MYRVEITHNGGFTAAVEFPNFRVALKHANALRREHDCAWITVEQFGNGPEPVTLRSYTTDGWRA